MDELTPAPEVVAAAATPRASGGIKDTFESILIALILAFVFRAFVVEAFVIPTGSMATTLLGAHMRFRCPDCGYDFDANFSAPPRPGSDDIDIPREATMIGPRLDSSGRVEYDANRRAMPELKDLVFSLHCPNCGYKLPEDDRDNPDQDAKAPPVHYGDRILVLKYAYLFHDPERWDVVVFKSPYDTRSHDRPESARAISKPEYQQNYIKRLIGLPGEELMVLDGDVYTRKEDGAPWTVMPKPRHVQEALWRLVNDNDYQPHNLPRGRAEPAFDTVWKTPANKSPFALEDAGRIFSFGGAGTAGLSFDPNAIPSSHALTEYMVFDSTQSQQERQSPNSIRSENQFSFTDNYTQYVASDLQLRATYQRLSGDGPLHLTLTKYGHRFTAELLPTSLTINHVKPDGSVESLGTAPLPAGSKPIDILFENVDYRVAFLVNGTELLASTPAQYAPDVNQLLADFNANRNAPVPEITVDATGQQCRLSHLSLWRDTYYTNRQVPGKNSSPRWAIPNSPLKLGKDEFFVMGDNSQLSLDARYWENDIDLPAEDLETEAGRVPGRFMLGKAFFVYWPAGHRPFGSSPGFVPNFGRMRVIH